MADTAVMSLARGLKGAFRGVIRERGEAYARQGRVSLTDVQDEGVRARVRGSGGWQYEVELGVVPVPGSAGAAPETAGADPHVLGAECGCPHFERGELCKHLWATLCVLDRKGWTPPALSDVAAFEEAEDEEEWDLHEMERALRGDRDPRAPTSGLAGRPEATQVGALGPAQEPGRPSPQKDWRKRLRRLASARSGADGGGEMRPHLDERTGALLGLQPSLLYVLDPEEVRRLQTVRVHLARRRLRGDGSLGPLVPARLRKEELDDGCAGADEAAARRLLLTLAQGQATGRGLAADPYGWGREGWSRSLPAPSAVEIPAALLDPLLPRLAETGRLKVGSVLPRSTGKSARGPVARSEEEASAEPRSVRLDTGPAWQLRLELAPERRAYAVRGRFVRGEETLDLQAPDLVLAPGFLVHADTLARADVGGSVSALRELRSGALRIPARELDGAVATFVETPGLPPLDLAPGVPWREEPGTPRPRLRFEGLGASEDGRRGPLVGARLDFGYGDAWVPAHAASPRVADPQARTLFVRDREAEAGAAEVLAELGFRPTHREDPGDGADAHEGPVLGIERKRFEATAEHLLAKSWHLEAEGARLRQAGGSSASVRSGMDFFELQGGMDFEGEHVPFPALLAAAHAQSDAARFVRLGDGSRGLLPRTWIERCAGMAALLESRDEDTDADESTLRFDRAQVGLLSAFLEAQDQSTTDRRFQSLRRALEGFQGIPAAHPPAGFRGTLRPYQLEGLAWLRFLRRFGLGGCLADDMGLGKTVQVLALLAGGAGSRRRGCGPSLVVAPRSVVHGWLAEAQRFVPRLRVLRYTGPERGTLRLAIEGTSGPRADLVVTTYGTLRRDADWLGEQAFDTVVLDEAQAIKNATSRTAQAARTLRAQHRLALTGTPVENHLGELASLLEFLNPGALGRARGLAALKRGRSPGTALDSPDLALLTRAIRPLLLRRTKAQVLPELPARTEQTLLCEMPATQRRHYDQLRRHYQASLGRRLERRGLRRSKIHVLEALLRLRQAACHSALLDPRRGREPSAKLEVLFQKLEEILEEGHKALVFSQFTRLLALVRKELEARDIDYAYLDGRTRDRKARIARFQEDPACRVFAISLKAGGTGLNLTAADYVFLLDPWWNPAVEAQAIDRTHRIGQTRPVAAYRLVAERTVEEKILTLQEQKRALSRAVLGDEKSLLGQLSAEDLEYLLG